MKHSSAEIIFYRCIYYLIIKTSIKIKKKKENIPICICKAYKMVSACLRFYKA